MEEGAVHGWEVSLCLLFLGVCECWFYGIMVCQCAIYGLMPVGSRIGFGSEIGISSLARPLELYFSAYVPGPVCIHQEGHGIGTATADTTTGS